MARYIDADKLDFSPLKDGFDRARAVTIIKFAPTADVEEVKRGYWKRESNNDVYWYVCSECRDDVPRNKYGGWSFPHYCPNCGAKMDGERK